MGDYDLCKEVFVRKGVETAGRPFEDQMYRFKIMNPEKEFGADSKK